MHEFDQACNTVSKLSTNADLINKNCLGPLKTNGDPWSQTQGYVLNTTWCEPASHPKEKKKNKS